MKRFACPSGPFGKTRDHRQGRRREEHGGRGISPSCDDDQEKAQGSLQEYDQVPEEAREGGEAVGDEAEGARRAVVGRRAGQEKEEVRCNSLKTLAFCFI